MPDIPKDLPDEAKDVLDHFKEFQLSSCNDSGANGFIMIGRHDVLKKDVAIKVYYHEENEVDQEPAIITSINHENVLKVYDARKMTEGCSYYMMPAANEGDLFDFSEKYYISTLLSHKLLCQLLSGLSALHCKENRLVHRDLKPENLLIHNDTLVIADFGSVRRVDDETGKTPSSKHSILYRPPEAFGDEAYFDFSSDVYQAGFIGYLLFGGKLSNDLLTHLNKKELKELAKLKKTEGNYEIETYIDSCLEKRIKAGKLLNWNTIPFFVPKKIVRILKKATGSPEKRFKNVSEFLSELAKVKASLPSWMADSEGCTLRNWKGNDYLLMEKNGFILLKKKRCASKKFRQDKSIKANSFSEAHEILKHKIKLP